LDKVMAEDSVEDELELQVVRAAEPFEDFFRREFPKMVAVAYAISGSRWAAEELAQEACLRAFKSWDSVSRYDKPGAWLRRVTINLSNSLLRRRLSEVKALERYVVGNVEVVDAHPVEEAEFWDQVKSLPRRQREVIVLHYVDGMDTGEIADVLDISESSVRTHLQRGRVTLVRKVDSGGLR
jgi:RNA polymerase sigma-70 factor (ECF subfamily)